MAKIENKWKNRTRMAWYSFWAMIAFTLMLWFAVPTWYVYMGIEAKSWTQDITSSAEWLYLTLGSVILGYMGTSMMMYNKTIQSKIETTEDTSETEDGTEIK